MDYVCSELNVDIANNKIPQNGQFEAISDYRIMQKWMVSIIEYPKHDPGTRTKPFKLLWLKPWDHG